MGKKAQKKVRKEALPQRLSGLKVWQLVLLLVVIIGGGVLFAGALAGWFDGKGIVLDSEVYCKEECDDRLVDINTLEYDGLLTEKKSFILMVDQEECKTADRMREYVERYADELGIRVYRMMFSEVKESSLHEYVKYYPSVVLVSKGGVVAWLKADEDEDADKYNDYESFRKWAERYISTK